MEILGSTANDIWQQAFLALDKNKSTQVQPSRVGDTSELLQVQLHLENPRERWILNRSPSINPAFALVEVIWIISGRDDAKYLNYWNAQLPKYAGTTDCYHGAYGKRLRQQLGFDQLERAYFALKNNPDSRQVVLEIWNPEMDFPDEMGMPVAPDIPCNTHAYLIVRDGKLEWTQFMRSNDIILGLPYNIIQFTSIQEIIAGWLDIPIGSYHHYSNSLHLYEANRARFKYSHIDTAHFNTDKLGVPKSESDNIFHYLNMILERIISENLSEKQFQDVILEANLPQAYKNWLYIIGAEEARRKSWNATKENFIISLTNPMLKQAWYAWYTRFESEG